MNTYDFGHVTHAPGANQINGKKFSKGVGMANSSLQGAARVTISKRGDSGPVHISQILPEVMRNIRRRKNRAELKSNGLYARKN